MSTAHITQPTARYNPRETRAYLIKRGKKVDHVVKYTYRPFDVRWCYWEPETKLLGEKSPEIFAHVISGNLWLEAREKQTNERFDRGTVCSALPDNFGSGFSSFFPRVLNDGSGVFGRINLPKPLIDFATNAAGSPESIFSHVIALLHAPAYRAENLGALRMGWPRVPISGDASILTHSAGLGETLSLLLNPEIPALGVSTGTLRPGLRVMGLPAKRNGAALDAADLALTAGWGSTQNAGGGAIVMPGRGLTQARDYTPTERAALETEAQAQGMTLDALLALIGTRTLDVHLNAETFWSNVPEKVWDYALGGYQVIKKWLSYRERSVLGRVLKLDEALYVSQMVRRIAAILMMGPALDANYRACAANAQSYEQLGLSRDAAGERKRAKQTKRGASKKLTPAMRSNREKAKSGIRDKKEQKG